MSSPTSSIQFSESVKQTMKKAQSMFVKNFSNITMTGIVIFAIGFILYYVIDYFKQPNSKTSASPSMPSMPTMPAMPTSLSSLMPSTNAQKKSEEDQKLNQQLLQQMPPTDVSNMLEPQNVPTCVYASTNIHQSSDDEQNSNNLASVPGYNHGTDYSAY
jgi:hypothetical protein